MDEEELLAAQCRKGDRVAFKTVYEKYAPVLMAICFRYLGNRMDAEDVLHNVFIKVFSAFAFFTYQGKGSLKAWLTKMAVNESLSFLRSQRKELDKTVDIEEMRGDLAGNGQDELEPSSLQSIPKETLMSFIAELPQGYRTVFNLYVFEGKSHREIGEMLGIEERTSSSQFSRARRLLRKRVTNYLNDKGQEE